MISGGTISLLFLLSIFIAALCHFLLMRTRLLSTVNGLGGLTVWYKYGGSAAALAWLCWLAYFFVFRLLLNWYFADFLTPYYFELVVFSITDLFFIATYNQQTEATSTKDLPYLIPKIKYGLIRRAYKFFRIGVLLFEILGSIATFYGRLEVGLITPLTIGIMPERAIDDKKRMLAVNGYQWEDLFNTIPTVFPVGSQQDLMISSEEGALYIFKKHQSLFRSLVYYSDFGFKFIVETYGNPGSYKWSRELFTCNNFILLRNINANGLKSRPTDFSEFFRRNANKSISVSYNQLTVHGWESDYYASQIDPNGPSAWTASDRLINGERLLSYEKGDWKLWRLYTNYGAIRIRVKSASTNDSFQTTILPDTSFIVLERNL